MTNLWQVEISALPRDVRGTTDPSAALGMTKERATLPWKVVAGQKEFFITFGGPQAHDHSGRDDKLVAFSILGLGSPTQVMTR
jgi:hypothetical protein